jgi:CheY-like chemotaxis protein
MAEILRGFNLEVSCAGNGAAALRSLRTARQEDRAFDFVLVDVEMPGQNGPALVQAMLDAGPGRERFFLMSPDVEDAAEEARARHLALTGFIAKPATPSTLLEALGEGLDGEHALRKGRTGPREQLADFSGARILLVEDNELNRLVASGMLESHGIEVRTAHSGVDAIAQFSEGERFDLVFMDIQMPGMDGFEATRALRAQLAGSKLPIVAMTAHAMAGDRERCLAAGMDDYISKPIVPDALETCLGRWLERRAAPPQADAAAARAQARDPGSLLAELKGRLGTFFPQEGLERVGGSAARLVSLLGMFARLHADGPASIRRMLEQGQWRALVREAHELAGAAGTIGLVVLMERARHVEELLGDEGQCGDPRDERIRAAAQSLQALLERTLAEIHAVLA